MSAPVLLLVHGYPFDHTLWQPVIPLLDRTIKVLAPDLPGFGGQPLLAGPPSMDAMAGELEKLLTASQVQRAVVAGMSMGGYVALAFAEHYAKRVAGLALVSSQAAADTEEARANRRAMIAKVRQEGPGVAAQATIPKLFAEANSGREDLTSFPKRGAELAGVEGIAWALEAMAGRPDRTKLLRALQVPVTIIHGTEDKFIPAQRARELGGLAARGTYVELRGAGHATPLEAPNGVADALNELVKRSFTPLPS